MMNGITNVGRTPLDRYLSRIVLEKLNYVIWPVGGTIDCDMSLLFILWKTICRRIICASGQCATKCWGCRTINVSLLIASPRGTLNNTV